MLGQQEKAVAGSTLRRMVLALAVPAFAASQKGNQIGNQTSGLNTSPYYGPGFGGQNNIDKAQDRIIDDIARSSHP